MKELIKCEYCDKEFSKKGIGTHIWRMHGQGINHDPNINYKSGTRSVWNKGLTKESNINVQKYSETLSKKYKSGELKGSFCGKKHSEETLLKLKKNGGLRKGAGRGKNGWYKGYWCDSTWELAFVIYNLDHNIKFERNKEGFEYNYNNKVHKFYPDFIDEDGNYIELKGFMNNQNLEKIKQFKYKIKIIAGEEIKQYIDYVTKKHSIKECDIQYLYENNIIN